MKAKIVGCGYLQVERDGVFKDQKCPRYDGDGCGDWCPLFGEVKIDNWRADETPIKAVTICEGVKFEVVE